VNKEAINLKISRALFMNLDDPPSTFSFFKFENLFRICFPQGPEAMARQCTLLAITLCTVPCLFALPIDVRAPVYHMQRRPQGTTTGIDSGTSLCFQAALRGGGATTGTAKSVVKIQNSIRMPVISCFFYFLSIALTAPAMPSMANKMINKDGNCNSQLPTARRADPDQLDHS
jgi:hypothetical protein